MWPQTFASLPTDKIKKTVCIMTKIKIHSRSSRIHFHFQKRLPRTRSGAGSTSSPSTAGGWGGCDLSKAGDTYADYGDNANYLYYNLKICNKHYRMNQTNSKSLMFMFADTVMTRAS